MVSDKLVDLRQEFFLFFIVADDDSRFAKPGTFFHGRKLGMRCRCSIVADFLDEVSVDFLRIQSQNHVLRHGEILDFRIRTLIGNMRFVKTAGLYADFLSVEVGDGLIFCRVSSGQGAGK